MQAINNPTTLEFYLKRRIAVLITFNSKKLLGLIIQRAEITEFRFRYFHADFGRVNYSKTLVPLTFLNCSRAAVIFNDIIGFGTLTYPLLNESYA